MRNMNDYEFEFDYDVPVWAFTATFTGLNHDITVRCDKELGNKEKCQEISTAMSRSLGRSPEYARWGVRILDISKNLMVIISVPHLQLSHRKAVL